MERFLNYFLLLNIPNTNKHFLVKYLNFIKTRKNVYEKYKTNKHHILPKCKDFFPQYSDLSNNKWNCVHLTHREHFIAHRLLHNTFKNSSQTRAYYLMCNNNKMRFNSRSYMEAKLFHVLKLIEQNKNPIRNKKISNALKNRPKSIEHRQKLMGKRPQHICLTISKGMKNRGNLSWKNDKERVQKHINHIMGKSHPKRTDEMKKLMSVVKMKNKLKTPDGIFLTIDDISNYYNIDRRYIKNIYRCLDKKPIEKKRALFEIKMQNKTWRELGWDLIPK